MAGEFKVQASFNDDVTLISPALFYPLFIGFVVLLLIIPGRLHWYYHVLQP
jgi:hypothetical protein